MEEQITIENLQQEVASLKTEKEGLQERVAALEKALKEMEASKDYWYRESTKADEKRAVLKNALAGLRAVIDGVIQD